MNNNLMVIESSNVLTMSSLEIAELTGKQHKNVLTDIRKTLNQLEINSAIFSQLSTIDSIVEAIAETIDNKNTDLACSNLMCNEDY